VDDGQVGALQTTQRLAPASVADLTPADRLSVLLTATPSLRADFFANPMKSIGRILPPPKYWDYGKQGWRWLPWYWYRPLLYRRQRRTLAEQIFRHVSNEVVDKTLSSAINTDSVFDEFFAPIVRVSQRSYTSISFLSWITFFAGLALIGVGAYVGVSPPANVNSTVVASVFGGTGVVSALGSVFGMVVTRIREATSDVARVRVVLTAFATQLGQLRALVEGSTTAQKEPTVEAVVDVNKAISDALSVALQGMCEPASQPAGSGAKAAG
jgi:hypothetical protein